MKCIVPNCNKRGKVYSLLGGKLFTLSYCKEHKHIFYQICELKTKAHKWRQNPKHKCLVRDIGDLK